ncbi:MAG: hypothetical protein J5716_06315 [Alphaproteobacteria bacterium]|nr:hypothetical protein [Alphaproteobacteria bacterium]
MTKNTTPQILIKLLKESVEKCYQNDKSLIDRGGMEQACVARIFYYMQDALYHNPEYVFFSSYNLDCEYNKNMQAPKTLSRSPNGTRPDLILHRRQDQPIRDNLLVVEFKARTSNMTKNDRSKLKGFTSPDEGYDYTLGVFVKLNKKEALYTFYQNGSEILEGNVQ